MSSSDSEPHTITPAAHTLKRRSDLRTSILKASTPEYVAPVDPPKAKQLKREKKAAKKRKSMDQPTAKAKRKRSHTTASPPPSNPQTGAILSDDEDDNKNDADADDDDVDNEKPEAPPIKRRKKKTLKTSQQDHDTQTTLASMVVASTTNHNDSDDEDYTQLVEGSDAFRNMKDRIWSECGIGKRGQAYEAPLFTIGTNLGTKYGQREKTEVYVDFIDHAACQKPNADLPQCGVLTLKFSKAEVLAMKKIDWRSLGLEAYKGQHMVAGLQRAVRHSAAVAKVQHNIYKSCMLIYFSNSIANTCGRICIAWAV
jgi:hypothetical protein